MAEITLSKPFILEAGKDGTATVADTNIVLAKGDVLVLESGDKITFNGFANGKLQVEMTQKTLAGITLENNTLRATVDKDARTEAGLALVQVASSLPSLGTQVEVIDSVSKQQLLISMDDSTARPASRRIMTSLTNAIRDGDKATLVAMGFTPEEADTHTTQKTAVAIPKADDEDEKPKRKGAPDAPTIAPHLRGTPDSDIYKAYLKAVEERRIQLDNGKEKPVVSDAEQRHYIEHNNIMGFSNSVIPAAIKLQHYNEKTNAAGDALLSLDVGIDVDRDGLKRYDQNPHLKPDDTKREISMREISLLSQTTRDGEKWSPELQKEYEATRQNISKQLDINGDGRVSHNEINAAVGALLHKGIEIKNLDVHALVETLKSGNIPQPTKDKSRGTP